MSESKNWYRDVLDIEPIIDEENFAGFKISETAKLYTWTSKLKLQKTRKFVKKYIRIINYKDANFFLKWRARNDSNVRPPGS